MGGGSPALVEGHSLGLGNCLRVGLGFSLKGHGKLNLHSSPGPERTQGDLGDGEGLTYNSL